MPIATFQEDSVHDDVGYHGCKYCDETTTTRRNDAVTYIDYWWASDFSKDPLQEALGLDPVRVADADFCDVYEFSDAWIARDFEGLPMV